VDHSKLTRQLRDTLERTPENTLIEVVVEIHPPHPSTDNGGDSRQERMAAHRKQFDATVEPVERRIRSAGGEVLDHAWLSQTLRARVPAGHVGDLAEPACVTSIDMPVALSRE
jgi:hypothetical protein